MQDLTLQKPRGTAVYQQPTACSVYMWKAEEGRMHSSHVDFVIYFYPQWQFLFIFIKYFWIVVIRMQLLLIISSHTAHEIGDEAKQFYQLHLYCPTFSQL